MLVRLPPLSPSFFFLPAFPFLACQAEWRAWRDEANVCWRRRHFPINDQHLVPTLRHRRHRPLPRHRHRPRRLPRPWSAHGRQPRAAAALPFSDLRHGSPETAEMRQRPRRAGARHRKTFTTARTFHVQHLLKARDPIVRANKLDVVLHIERRDVVRRHKHLKPRRRRRL